MAKIFISYRREDSIAYSGRLYDRLNTEFGKGQVFMDIDSIDPGSDFIEVIEQTVADCDAVLVVIGRQWLTVADAQGRRRIENPADFVRLEVETALSRKVRVVPVLVGGAQMPRSDELPLTLGGLLRKHALDLPDTAFHQALDRLIASIRRDEANAREQAEQERLVREVKAREQAEQERLAREATAREQAEQERLAREAKARKQAQQRYLSNVNVASPRASIHASQERKARLDVESQLVALRGLLNQVRVSDIWLSQVFEKGWHAFSGIPCGRELIDYPVGIRRLAARGEVQILETRTRDYHEFNGELFREDIRFRIRALNVAR